MKIALIGATGNAGSRILQEAQRRGHEVTVLTRGAVELPGGLQNVPGSLFEETAMEKLLEGQEVLISAYGPQHGKEEELIDATRTLIAAVRKSGNVRLLVVGGAGSLEVAPGLQLAKTESFPAAWLPIANAHAAALDLYRQADIDWTYLSPSALFEPGTRTGTFRIGGDELLVDDAGQSRISMEDFAVALLDELEEKKFPNQRFTVGY